MADSSKVPEATLLDAVNETVNQPQVATSSGTRKRKITWWLTDWCGDDDGLNMRENDGTLKQLKDFTGNFQISPTEDDEDFAFLKAMFDMSDKPYYDPVEIALGSLKKSEYFLVPSNLELDICPIEDIGARLESFKVPTPTIAAVYSLAKQQAAEMKFSPDNQVKWAVLRIEGFKFGWFARQEYTMHKPLPSGYMTSMLADYEKIKEYTKKAYMLCLFLPFLTEFSFRSYGSGYTTANAANYIAKASVLAKSANLADCLSYMDQDILHGKALLWIGVKRPMEALRNATSFPRVPHPFQVRAHAAPARQALITSSVAVIVAIKVSGWWEDIKKAAGYEDELLVDVGAEILACPWRYHMLYHAYGETVLTDVEMVRVKEAKSSAMMFAPILQAYIDTVKRKSSLANIKTIKKYADNNKYLYTEACEFFEGVSKGKYWDFEDLFKTKIIDHHLKDLFKTNFVSDHLEDLLKNP